MTAPVSVDELQRAWSAVQAGQFRTDGVPRRERSEIAWTPAEQVVVVTGASSRVGATAVALAIGETSDVSTRLIEYASADVTGLAEATSAELGVSDGWRRGARGDLLIERPAPLAGHHVQPTPAATTCELTILDVGLGAGASGQQAEWLSNVVATAPLVVVGEATIPGLHALNRRLDQSPRSEGTWCAVIGPPVRRWPRALRSAWSPRLHEAVESGRLRTVPEDPHLRMTGLTPEPLPQRVTTACAPIVRDITRSIERNLP